MKPPGVRQTWRNEPGLFVRGEAQYTGTHLTRTQVAMALGTIFQSQRSCLHGAERGKRSHEESSAQRRGLVAYPVLIGAVGEAEGGGTSEALSYVLSPLTLTIYLLVVSSPLCNATL